MLGGFAVVLAAVWETARRPAVAGRGRRRHWRSWRRPSSARRSRFRSRTFRAARLSLSTVFILGAAVLYGWEAAVVVAVLTRGTLEIVERRPRVKLYFNCARLRARGGRGGCRDVAVRRAPTSTTRLVFEVLAGATAF